MKRFPRRGSGGRWVVGEALHLTLAFKAFLVCPSSASPYCSFQRLSIRTVCHLVPPLRLRLCPSLVPYTHLYKKALSSSLPVSVFPRLNCPQGSLPKPQESLSEPQTWNLSFQLVWKLSKGSYVLYSSTLKYSVSPFLPSL